MEILQMSMSASVLILFVLGVRRFFGKKISGEVLNLLWAIACCKLLLPFSFSSLFGKLLDRAGVRYESLAGGFAAKLEPLRIPRGVFYGPGAAAPQARAFAKYLWLAGAACLALYFIYVYVRSVRILRTALPAEKELALRLRYGTPSMTRRVRVRISDRVASPLTYGIFRPVIVLPKETGGRCRGDLRYVLAHETAHIERWDCARKLCLAAALVFHWFNPLVWWMYHLANRDIELACDERVIRSAGRGQRRAYADMLVEWASAETEGSLLLSHLTEKFMEERIINIMKPKRVTVAGLILSVLVLLGAMVVYAAAPAEADNEVEAAVKNAVSVPEEEAKVRTEVEGQDVTTEVYADDPTLGGIFETYTPEEYAEVVEMVKKYSDGTEEDFRSMEADLERLRADNGKGEFVIYKGAFEKTYETEDGGMIAESFDARIVMAPEQMGIDFTGQEYREAMADVERFMSDAVAGGRATEEQKDRVMAKMQENLAKF